MTRTITSLDVSWFLDINNKGQLDLDPPYQRKSVWTAKDRRFFIDTILNNYPAPPVFLHKSLNENGRPTYHVVDGKQRLQTIIDFPKDKIKIPDDFSDINLKNKKWSQVDRTVREQFWNYVLIVEMLPSVGDAEIRDTFERINRNSRKLARQEIRHAKYDGWLIKSVEAEADTDYWSKLGIVTAARAKRMADVQFISELFAVVLKHSIHGFDQDFLDDIYAEYEEPEEVVSFVLEDFSAEINRIKNGISRIIEIQPNNAVFLKKLANFYTLWAFIALATNEDFNFDSFSTEYYSFMNNVDVVVDKRHGYEAFNADSNEVIYAENSAGASTDASPRFARHKSLVLSFRNLPGVINENIE